MGLAIAQGIANAGAGAGLERLLLEGVTSYERLPLAATSVKTDPFSGAPPAALQGGTLLDVQGESPRRRWRLSIE